MLVYVVEAEVCTHFWYKKFWLLREHEQLFSSKFQQMGRNQMAEFLGRVSERFSKRWISEKKLLGTFVLCLELLSYFHDYYVEQIVSSSCCLDANPSRGSFEMHPQEVKVLCLETLLKCRCASTLWWLARSVQTAAGKCEVKMPKLLEILKYFLRLCTFLPCVSLDFNFTIHALFYYKGSKIYWGKNEQV